SSFTFTIDVQHSQAVVKKENPAALPANSEKHILLTDDNAAALKVLQELLSRQKFLVTAVLSAKEALKVLSEPKTVDLVITDMHMPAMNGLELAEQINAERTGTPVILLSSVGNESRKNEYPGLVTAIISKPVKQRQFIKLVQHLLTEERNTQQKEAKSGTLLSSNFAENYPLSILLAEDNLINQKLATRILSKL